MTESRLWRLRQKSKMAYFRRLLMRKMTTGDVTLVFWYTGRLFLMFGVAFRAKKGKAFSPLSETYLCNKNNKFPRRYPVYINLFVKKRQIDTLSIKVVRVKAKSDRWPTFLLDEKRLAYIMWPHHSTKISPYNGNCFYNFLVMKEYEWIPLTCTEIKCFFFFSRNGKC